MNSLGSSPIRGPKGFQPKGVDINAASASNDLKAKAAKELTAPAPSMEGQKAVPSSIAAIKAWTGKDEDPAGPLRLARALDKAFATQKGLKGRERTN